MRVYLAGPINGCTDDEAKGWRERVKELVAPLGIEAFDPMDRDYRGREQEPGIAEKIVEQDKADIDAVAIVLVCYEKPSVGTSMEVLYAYERGKGVIVVNKSGKALSPWLLYHSHAQVETFERAVELIAEGERRMRIPTYGPGARIRW